MTKAIEADVELLRNRKSNDEGELRSAWLEKHKNASSLVFDEKTGVPHQAIYEYPMSTIAHEQEIKALFMVIRDAMEREGTNDDE